MDIPGVISVPDRSFWYIEAISDPDFFEYFDIIGAKWSREEIQSIRGGGIMTENVLLTLPSGKRLYGLSAKGNFAAWDRAVREAATQGNRDVGIIQEEHLVLSSGSIISLQQCEASEYQVKRRRSKKVTRQEPPVITIMPCPFCGQPLRTPQAKQCRHCHADWH